MERGTFKVVSNAGCGSLFRTPACLCSAYTVLSGRNGLHPDFAGNVLAHHVAQLLGVREGGMGSSVWKATCPTPSPPFFLMSPWVFSCRVCAHPIIRKCFIVYVPITHHVFLFLRRRALTEQESRASCSPLYFQSLEEFLAEGNCLGSTISNSSKCFLARDTDAPKREVTRLRSHIVERPEPVLPGNGCHR